MTEKRKKGKGRILLIMFLLACICSTLSPWIIPAMKDLAKRPVRREFDRYLQKMEATYSVPDRGHTSVWHSLPSGPFIDKQSEEYQALDAYLTAYNELYADPSPEKSINTLTWVRKHLACVKDIYDGYYAELILRFKYENQERLKAVQQAENQAPMCVYENCTRHGEAKWQIDTGQVKVYQCCTFHRCSEEECDKPRYSLYYCKEHSPKWCLCAESGCDEPRESGSRYCKKHICQAPGCKDGVAPGSRYCYAHQTDSGSSTKTKRSSGSSTKTSSGKARQDMYDAWHYDDADDFADEWADEFGDGDYDGGWDDAWDYWQDNH